jgi:site-specific recombinase XerD
MTTQTQPKESTTATLAKTFLEEGVYLRNWSPKTVISYQQSLRNVPASITKASLNEMVVAMRQRGLTAGGINVRLRSINSFLTWLHEGEHLAERHRLKTLKAERKVITTFSDVELKKITNFKPQGINQKRAWTLVMLLLDTGLRIEELLALERSKARLDDLILTVMGKGSKERMAPISPEGRKVLYRQMQSRSGKFVFETRNGLRVTYRNAYRDIKVLMDQIGVQGSSHPHSFRHAFAVNYIRKGGDIYRLSRILGHTSITTTQLYLRSLDIEHLRESHTSPLTA